MAKPRVAIVGLGMAVTPHVQSYVDLRDRVEVAYAFSPSEERRRAFVERFPFPLADSLDQILADDSVTVVTLLTPPNTHLELVRRCTAAGKHILLEKPLEIGAARCSELVKLCQKRNMILGVVLQHRFRPAGQRLRELLQADAIGRIVSASVSILNWRPQSYYDEPGRGDRNRDGGGVLLTQWIHKLDLFLSLVGMPEQVFAYACTSAVHEMETEDLVAGCLRFPGGALGTVHATTIAYPGSPETIAIIGESGTAQLSGTSLTVDYRDGRRESHKADSSSGGTGADPMAFSHDYHRALIADFLDAVEQGWPLRIRGREALKVHRFIDCLLESDETGRPVSVKPTANAARELPVLGVRDVLSAPPPRRGPWRSPVPERLLRPGSDRPRRRPQPTYRCYGHCHVRRPPIRRVSRPSGRREARYPAASLEATRG